MHQALELYMSKTLVSVTVAILATCLLTVGCGGGGGGGSPSGVPVTGVSVKAATTIVAGGTEQLRANVAPANATDQAVTWASSNAAVATVSDDGLVKAVSAGTANVTVTTHDGGKTAVCVVTVSPATVSVTGITLDHATLALAAGAPGTSATLAAIVAPANATNQNVTWSTSDASIAALDTTAGSSVTVTALGAGTATITATTQDGARTATCVVTVSPVTVAVTGIALDHTALRLVAGSPAATLTATVAPANATNQSVTWSTSDASVARLSATAGGSITVTAAGAGTATITATTEDGARTATCVVTVSAVAVTGIALDHTTLLLVAGSPGTAATLAATIAPANATDQSVTWSTSDASVARLSATTGGSITVTALAGGTATITATTHDGGKTATCTVSVALLDVSIPATTASTELNPSSESGKYDSKADGNAYSEMAVGPLVFYSEANGFEDGDADQGIFFNWYASGAAGATVGVTQSMKSYVGIPAASIPTTSPSVKVTVTAKASAASTSARIALLVHGGLATGRVVAMSDVLGTTPASYVFDGLPPNLQLDLCDGGPNGQSLFVEAIRVEPSTTPPIPGFLPALLDEALSSTFAKTVNDAATATGAPGTEVTVSPSHLLYYVKAAGTYFKGNDGKFMFNYRGIDPTVLGATAANVYMYVAVPATYATTTSTSLKITIMATQYSASTGLNLVLLDSGNKVIASLPLAAGASSGATPAAYVFDGVVPNGEIRIAGDASYLYLTNVKVEASTTAVTFQ